MLSFFFCNLSIVFRLNKSKRFLIILIHKVMFYEFNEIILEVGYLEIGEALELFFTMSLD